MKKILIGVAAICGLAIAAVLIGPSFVDWNSYKGQIAQQAVEITGRAVEIDGDVSLRVVPTPELSATRIRVANAEQGADADMATVEQLQVRVAFWPLLKGQVQVESVSLIEPRLLLEVYADGRNNWTLGAMEAATDGKEADPADPRASQRPRSTSAPFSSNGSDGKLRIDSLSLRGATLLYRDATTGREETLENLDADVVAESLAGPFSLQGEGRFQGYDAAFEIATGRWVEEGATQLSTTLSLPVQNAEAKFSGTVSRHAEGTFLRGKVRLSGANLSTALLAAGVLSSGNSALGKAFRLEADVSADAEKITAREIVMALNDVEVAGEFEFEHQVPRKASLALNASRLDLDSLLDTALSPPNQGNAEAGATGAAPAATRPGSTAGPAVEVPGFEIPADLEASIQLVVDAAIYREQVLRQILFNADVTDGRLVIGEAAALLPGGSDVALSGVLSTPDGVPNFDGRLDAAADNLRGVLQWAGVDVGAVPADRLRKTTFSSRVTATPELLTVSDMDLQIDVTRINGGISVAMRERPGFGIGLAVDRLDLDAYLPREEGAASVVQNRPAQVAPANSPAAETNTTLGAAQETPPDLSFLDRFDANLDLRVSNLSYQDAVLRDLHLDGTLQAASLVVRSLDVGDLSGAQLQASGEIGALTGEPSINGRVGVKVEDPGRLDAVIGKAARDLERFGALSVDTALTGSLQDLNIDAVLTGQGGQVTASGPVRSMASDPSFDLALDAKHPDFNGLLRVLAPDAGISAGPGAFALEGRLVGSPEAVSLENANLKAGTLTVTGRLAADLSADVPRLSLDLETNEIRTGDFSAPSEGRTFNREGNTGVSRKRSSGTGTAPGGAAANSSAQPDLSAVHPRWSRAPIDLSGLAALDGDFKLRSKAIVVDDLRLEQSRIEGELKGGVLSLSRFQAEVYGGTLQASGSLDARGMPLVDVKLDAAGLDAGRLVRDLADSKRISGTLNLDASLKTRGTSEAALVRALNGSGKLGGDVTAKVKAEEQLGNVVLGILGTKVKEIRGVSDATTALFSAFAGAPAKLSGSFKVDQGVVATEDTRIDGRNASIFTAGRADLPAWLLASRSDLFRSEDADQVNPYVVAEVNGVLDEPNVKVGGVAFKRKNSSGSGGSSSSGSGASSSEKVKPEDAIRGLLKELVR